MLQAVTQPAHHGRIWLREGALIFRQSPITWASMMAVYVCIVALISRAFPFELSFFALMALHGCFIVSFMTLAKLSSQSQERYLSFQLLFSGFSASPGGLIFVGLIMGAIFLVLAALWIGSNPAIYELLGNPSQPIHSVNELKPVFDGRFALFMIGNVLVTWLFVYAFGLVAFYGIPPVKAIVFSAVGAVRNWRPWALYLLGLISLLFTPFLILIIISYVFPMIVHFIPHIMTVYWICVASPIIYSSIYISLIDVFQLSHTVDTVA